VECEEQVDILLALMQDAEDRDAANSQVTQEVSEWH